MSKLVILEGFLNQKIKNKDNTEVYAVLTTPCLKIYRSQIAYKQNPNSPIRSLEFANNFNVIPMTSQMFSLFKRGEKADERLYLEASSKTDYDLWLSNIDGLINKKHDSNTSANTDVVDTAQSRTTDSVVPAKVVDTPVVARTPSPRYNIRTGDDKQAQQMRDKLEADLQKEKRIASDAAIANEDLQTKFKKSEQKIVELEKEIKDLKEKTEKAKNDKNKFSDAQLTTASNRICKSMTLPKTNYSSYEFVVSYLCADDTQSSFIKSFLRHQLEYLIHRSPIETTSNLSLSKYLIDSTNMSKESLAEFVSTFLLTLSKQINPAINTGSDLIEHLNSVIASVVQMDPSPQLVSSNKSFQQTALEISYLIAPRGLRDNQLSNGYSEPSVVTEQFNALVKSANIDTVTKTFFVELGNYMREQSAIKTSTDTKMMNNVQKENLVNQHFADLWNDLHIKLKEKEQEVKDLYITIALSGERILELEKEVTKPRENGYMDTYVNYYISATDNLCSTCQSNICTKLKSPVVSMTDKLVEDFTSYWKCISDLANFLAKKKTTTNDVKDAIDMSKKCTQKYELLMRQFEEISHRTIKKPASPIIPNPSLNE